MKMCYTNGRRMGTSDTTAPLETKRRKLQIAATRPKYLFNVSV